jgi:N-acetylglutamate synthase-like GNAT family acetyltransferase
MIVAGGSAMKVIDISGSHVATYCKCLEDWSSEFDDEGGHKKLWYEKEKAHGLKVKLAEDDNGDIVGMIHYMPAEYAPIIGKDVYYVYCVWVHGYKKGVGNHQHKGIGKMLLKAAEEDVRASGAKGLAAWGVTLPFFMRSSWFKKQGYKKVDKDGMSELVLKSFVPDGDIEKPALIKQNKKIESGTDRVKISAFMNGWCPGQNIVYERAKKVAEEFPDRVEFVGFDTTDRKTLMEYGIVDGLFVDDRQIRSGPPPSYEKIRKIVEKRLRKRRMP